MNECELCPVCRSEPTPKPFYSGDEWIVLRCSSCTFAWVVDIQNPPESSAFDWGQTIVIESQKRHRMYEDRLKRVEKYSPSPRAWLDIGCGGGGLLVSAARLGYAAEGIELGPSAELVTERFGIPVHRRVLSEVIDELRFQEFGVVSYFHVLEHVYDPLSELIVARQLLGERSILVVEVPFFDSLFWRIQGSHHRHFYRGHRSYFNQKSIRRLLDNTGFAIIESRSVPYQMSFIWLLTRIGMQTSFLRRLLPPGISDRSVTISSGEYLLVMAKKR